MGLPGLEPIIERAKEKWWLWPAVLAAGLIEHWIYSSLLEWLEELLGEHRHGIGRVLYFVAQNLVSITWAAFAMVLVWKVVLGPRALTQHEGGEGEDAGTGPAEAEDEETEEREDEEEDDDEETEEEDSSTSVALLEGWSNAIHMITLRSQKVVAADTAATSTELRERIHELLVALALETGRSSHAANRVPHRVAVLGRGSDNVLRIRGEAYCTPHERFRRRHEFRDGQGLCWGAINAAAKRSQGAPPATNYNHLAEMRAAGFRSGDRPLRSAVLAPFFLSSGTPAGVIAVDSDREQTFDELDVLLVSIAASAIGAATRRFG